WRGMLIWAPYLVVLVPIGIKTRKQMPDWVSAAAVGGILYLLIQLRANRFSGGDGHFAYRYPLETLTAAAPWAFLSYTNGIGKQSRLQLYLIALILGTVCVQLAGATLT